MCKCACIYVVHVCINVPAFMLCMFAYMLLHLCCACMYKCSCIYAVHVCIDAPMYL